MCNATLISVDIQSQVHKSDYGIFIEQDDILFANRFKEFCEKKNITPEIDILFIDTSHEYNHTIKEIQSWFPFLSKHAKVFFHDANVTRIYKRKNGTIGKAYNDKRDIMRALEKCIHISFDETKPFISKNDEWLIIHQENCNGMTMFCR